MRAGVVWLGFAACVPAEDALVAGVASALPADEVPPPPFTLGGDTWMQPGASFDLVAAGAPFNELVGYVASPVRGGAPFCPAATAPTCFSVSSPAQVIGVTAADTFGVSTYSRRTLPGARQGQLYGMQAASRARGGAVVLSTPYDVRVLPVGLCHTNFSGPFALLGDSGDPEPLFAPFGVHFSGTAPYGLVGGDAEGDSTNWSDGTNVMTPGWGVHDNGNDVSSITFDQPVQSVAVTLERANGASSIDLQVTGTLGGAPQFISGSTITTQKVTVSFFTPVDRLDFELSGPNGFAFVVDDLVWTPLAGGCP